MKAVIPQPNVPIVGDVKTGLMQQDWYQAFVTLVKQKLSRDGSNAMTGPLTLASYTVAALPAVGAAQVAYASDGRKNGEGAGTGTGVMVFSDASAWIACDSGVAVAA